MTPDHVSHAGIEQRADELLASMTLAEKIGQMSQVEKNSITPEQVATYAIGSVLSGGGGNPVPNSPEHWRQMVLRFEENALESRLGIPLIYGVDAVHGHNNVVGATIFPHNIGLGASRDADLVARALRVTAREMLATAVHWDFAPCVAVPQDFRWGRTYEGFSDQPDIVSELGAATVRGLQGHDLSHPHAVLASVKHFVGDGGTTWGSTEHYAWIPNLWQGEAPRWSIDQGVTECDEATLRAVHLPPYQAAIDAGARNIMVSYSTWGGVKMHAHKYLLTDVLKGEMGFSGFLVSDWMGISQIDPDYYRCVVASVNAGIDMIMIPFDFERFITTLTKAVEAEDVAMARIDDAVRRILRVKLEMDLWERPFGDANLLADVGSIAHRAVAREAVRKSLVLLKNDGDTLPLPKNLDHILVAGRAANDIGLQCGGWTIGWQGSAGAVTPGTTLLDGIRAAVSDGTAVTYSEDGFVPATTRADVGIVVVSEEPYAEGDGDHDDLTLSSREAAIIARVRPLCERLVVILLSGRPLIIDNLVHSWDACIAAWLPGSEGAGVSDVLFGDYPFTGRLPMRWPRTMPDVPPAPDADALWPVGHGLTRKAAS